MRYLYDNNVSTDLSLRLKVFVERVIETSRIQEDDVPFISILPTGLRSQLDLEIKAPSLAVHPLLRKLTFDSELIGSRMCQLLRQIGLHYGEALFQQAQNC